MRHNISLNFKTTGQEIKSARLNKHFRFKIRTNYDHFTVMVYWTPDPSTGFLLDDIEPCFLVRSKNIFLQKLILVVTEFWKKLLQVTFSNFF